MDRTTGKVEVTAHNHGFAVDAPLDGEVAAPSDGALGTTYGRVRVSHVCLNDDVVEGLECLDLPAYSVQYHPEAAAGPHDAGYLFDRFLALMDQHHSTDSTDATDQEGRA
jgi:carbamoyl-phosphate synthase small subunit